MGEKISLSDYLQGFNPEFPSGDKLAVLALAGWALGIPGGCFEGKGERAGVALQLSRDPGNTQPRSFGDCSFAHEIKVALDPLVIKVADLPDFQMDFPDFFGLMAVSIIKSNFQDTLSDGQFVHVSGQFQHLRGNNDFCEFTEFGRKPKRI